MKPVTMWTFGVAMLLLVGGAQSRGARAAVPAGAAPAASIAEVAAAQDLPEEIERTDLLTFARGAVRPTDRAVDRQHRHGASGHRRRRLPDGPHRRPRRPGSAQTRGHYTRTPPSAGSLAAGSRNRFRPGLKGRGTGDAAVAANGVPTA